MAVVFHEYAHGWMANRWGDKTAQESGRLTLNPLAHADWMGTFILPILMMLSPIGGGILFGWAKPVPINPNRFRKFRPGLFWVSSAGILMNILLAFFCATVLCLVIRFVPGSSFLSEPLQWMATLGVYTNYSLALFNLLPFPPLDGSRIIESFLSYNAQKKFESLSSAFSTVFTFLVLASFFGFNFLFFLTYPISFAGSATMKLAMSIFGISLV